MSRALIAIVDDDESMRRALVTLVRALGHDAVSFGSAGKFLESETLHHTSCLITDLQMPQMSGLELQGHLAVEGHRIPIIFITGHPDDRARARAMKAGAVCFLSKPFEYHRLLACLETALKAA